MGNTHTKEARSGARLGLGPNFEAGGSSSGAVYNGEAHDRSRRASRAEFSGLGLPFGGSSGSRQQDVPFEHRETKQEKEARRLERERLARINERERSMKEEHVDGGFLVTTGIYNASEDFSKPIVRQLQIERKIAPFWRGLDDFNENWAEHQIIAAARALEIPPADQVPEHLVPQSRSTDSPGPSTPNIQNLTVPIGPRTLSASSDRTASNPGSSLPSPTSPAPPRTSSPLKPQRKSLAAALNLSRNGSQVEITPREVNLPNDPFVNGQPFEVFLYKEGVECPLCLMYYPPYLNRTRCCQQLICSECFVQIKRPDPHFPEHHGDESDPQAQTHEEPDSELIMEPAKCPYCTQTEFGVTYEPPPFRRGLTYAFNPALGAMGTAMSSTSSLNSSLSPTSATPPYNANRRRAQSLSANAPGVITTDRIRPDWSTKLAAARAHQRRRAAAADALHHAAFVMGNQESRTIFGRPRFGRRHATGSDRGNESPRSGSHLQPGEGGSNTPSAPEPGPRISSGRTGPSRERIDAAHLESLMMAEAIRLSLADEEERRKKAEKEAKKEAKKREKDDRKASKKKADVYGGGGSSGSASSLSLGFGRKRDNSAASNLRVETSASTVSPGRGGSKSAEPASGSVSPSTSNDKGKAVDRGENEEGQAQAASTLSLPIPIASQPPRGSSHLRHMSNASSVSSSAAGSVPGSYTGRTSGNEDPRASGLSLGGRSEGADNSNSESMFNFRSLAEMVGVPIDEAQLSGDPDESPGAKAAEGEEAAGEHVEYVEHAPHPPVEHKDGERNGERNGEQPGPETHGSNPGAAVTEEEREGSTSPPEVMVTPDTPVPLNDSANQDSKQLGHVNTAERRPYEVTQ
ncbi:hypothetical protein F4779DRAFT_454597 [Xylariaceae sp. FL0662B]|nr:hypothetical protein F4779DRAFT_454597 [Xylariaceae sp. FL0662B]